MKGSEFVYFLSGLALGIAATLLLCGCRVDLPGASFQKEEFPPSLEDHCVFSGPVTVPKGHKIECTVVGSAQEDQEEPSEKEVEDVEVKDVAEDLPPVRDPPKKKPKAKKKDKKERPVIPVAEEDWQVLDKIGDSLAGTFRDFVEDLDVEELEEIAGAQEEAQLVLGGLTWEDLDDARRQVWIELCYETNCRDFKEAAGYTVIGDYRNAAREILRSQWADQNPKAATRLAKRMRRGDR